MKENNKKNGLVSFFEEFPMINATALARYIGINDTLMRQYKKVIHTCWTRNWIKLDKQYGI